MKRTQQKASASEKSPLDHCKSLIEQQLAWGDSAGWTAQDYEALSRRIQEKTGRVISATTLKRIWGHITYNSRPSQHSLTTLASFLGHSSWRAFTATLTSAPATPVPPHAELSSPVPVRRMPRPTLYFFGLIVLLSTTISVWMSLNNGPVKEQNVTVSSEVFFQSRPVAQGLPNTVIFEYDVSGVAADSFFIQQSWDQRRRTPVSPKRHTFTSTYYYPGFFNAKLIANDSTLKEHSIHVKTQGWLALVEHKPIPLYVKDTQPSNGYLSISDAWLGAQEPDVLQDPQITSFFNVRDFGSLHTDNFSLETSLRRQMNDGRYPCRRATIVVTGEHGALAVPLSIPGCVGDLSLMLGDVYLSGATNDLSAFGTDLSRWQPVHLTVKDRNVRIQIGSNAPYIHRFERNLGKVVGLRYSFEGVGAIDFVTLKDGQGTIVYEETF